MTDLLLKISSFIYHKKKSIFLLWVILFILSILSFVLIKRDNLETELTGLENTEAYQLKKTLEKDFNLKLGSSSAIVLEQNNLNFKENNISLSEDIKKEFLQINNVFKINSEKKHQLQLFYITYNPKFPINEMQSLTPKIRDYLKDWSIKNKINAYFTGSTAFQYDAKVAGKNDSKNGELLGVLFSLFILILTFGGLLSAFLPLLIGISTLVFLNAIIKIFNLSINPISMILSGLLGLALAIDYSLFMVSRFREERENNNIEESVKSTLINSGKTVFYSGLIMLFSISGLLLPDVSITRTVILNLFLVISISLINSIFFLPTFLIIFDRYLDKPLFLNNLIKKSDTSKFWFSITNHVTDNPKKYFILSVSLLFIISIPAFYMKVWSPIITIAPKNSESIKAYNLLQKDGWGGELVPINIIVESKNNVYDKEFISFIYDLTKNLEKYNKVQSVQSLTSIDKSFSKEAYINLYNSIYSLNFFNRTNNKLNNPLVNYKNGNNLTLLNVYPIGLTDLKDSFEIIDFIKEYRKNNPKFNISVGGTVARVEDLNKELYSYIPQMLGIIFISIYLLLFFHTKSIILPLKAGIMNFLPILSSFGIITLIFQYGYLQNVLGTPFNGAVTNIVPIILFCVVFGLSMDYEILILSRINESFKKSNNVKLAIIEGMTKSSSLITGAAFILIAVFIPGIFSSSSQIGEISLGIVSAILIDATIVRLFLVPSFMMLMGKYNWWNPLDKK